MTDIEPLWEAVRFAADNAAIDVKYEEKSPPLAKIVEASVKAAFELAIEQGLVVLVRQGQWPDTIPMCYPSERTDSYDGDYEMDHRVHEQG